MKDAVLNELRQAFRPEFLNRLDEIIVFHALTEGQLKEIVEIQLSGLRSRLAERHVELSLTDSAKTALVRNGYDPAYGARPLKRAIQREVETPLAKRILAGEIREGQSILLDTGASGGLTFTVTESKKEAVAV
jgi:ATP-dependent Clp protease ATP-binding subunit ClpB